MRKTSDALPLVSGAEDSAELLPLHSRQLVSGQASQRTGPQGYGAGEGGGVRASWGNDGEHVDSRKGVGRHVVCSRISSG